jgi:hypothetical protein
MLYIANPQSRPGALTALNLEDLERLETEIKVTGLEQNHGGFFFGSSQRDDSQDADDLEFIRDARRAIEEGDTVYYDSWW